MLSRQQEAAERLEVIENEKRLRGSTLSQFATSEAETPRGRFAAISSPRIVGSTPIPKYEGAPNWANCPVPTEPPLGFDNPAADPSSTEVALPREETPDPERSQASSPLARSGSGSLFRRF